MSGGIWYFALNNQQQGPIAEEDLRNLFATGQLSPNTLVWSQGLSDWTAANQLPAFAAGSPQASAAPNMVAATAPAQSEPYAPQSAAPNQQWSPAHTEQPQSHAQAPGGNGHEENAPAGGDQLNSANAPSSDQAQDYAAGGFQTTPEPFHLQQTGVTASEAQQQEDWSSAQNLSAEEQSARLREIVASAPPRSAANTWDNLDAIPTPKSAVSSDLAAQLDAIGKPATSAPSPTAADEPTPQVRAGGLADSGHLRKLMDVESRSSSSALIKGAANKNAGGNPVSLPVSSPAASRLAVGADDYTTPHPWRRWWARCIDDSIYNIPMLVFLYLARSASGADVGAVAAIGRNLVFTAIALFFGFIFKLVLEAVVLGKFGTSVGKRSFNIHLSDETTGGPMSISLAVKRTGWLALFSGWVVMAIPFIGPLISGGCCVWQYFELTNNGKSIWDKNSGVRYEHHPLDSKAKTMLVCAIIGCLIIQTVYGVLTLRQVFEKILTH